MFELKVYNDEDKEDKALSKKLTRQLRKSTKKIAKLISEETEVFKQASIASGVNNGYWIRLSHIAMLMFEEEGLDMHLGASLGDLYADKDNTGVGQVVTYDSMLAAVVDHEKTLKSRRRRSK